MSKYKSRRQIVLKNRLKEIRAEKGLTQLELAIKAGTTQNNISQIETFKYSPTAYNALLIAYALDCKVEDIFYFDVRNQ